MCAAVRMLDIKEGDAVLIREARLVGLSAAALCSAKGARCVMVTDIADERLEKARAFGATHVCNVRKEDETKTFASASGPRGFDAAIEVCGAPAAIPSGLRALRIGGSYLTAGCVFPGATAVIDFQQVATRLHRIIGLHNYTPEDLQTAIQFLVGDGREVSLGEGGREDLRASADRGCGCLCPINPRRSPGGDCSCPTSNGRAVQAVSDTASDDLGAECLWAGLAVESGASRAATMRE